MPTNPALTDLLVSQLSDPFRIGLILALFVTMLRTRANTGLWAPLALGAVFVAVVIPVTGVAPALAGVPLVQAVAVGLVANVILLAVILAGWSLWQRLRG